MECRVPWDSLFLLSPVSSSSQLETLTLPPAEAHLLPRLLFFGALVRTTGLLAALRPTADILSVRDLGTATAHSFVSLTEPHHRQYEKPGDESSYLETIWEAIDKSSAGSRTPGLC